MAFIRPVWRSLPALAGISVNPLSFIGFDVREEALGQRLDSSRAAAAQPFQETMLVPTASATLMPSMAAERMPPA